ncbi:hypothetical protein MPTK1_6g08260 [Marchantia polymorpha subsp. ruderalis]|nr:hypothetical protein MARPO_0060s0095 [Marchantia polymorpha]BBN14021.1 hypothetical protein Mp_6g08260 [Marchantia polymorpha subsp. ruderalis]|eukprot:PTQ37024.1 hypothetical protein MARPO_0060s0095 [Marchantia polymorpha]
MNCVETYLDESASQMLSRRVRRMGRRKRHDRVPLESSQAGFAVRMHRKLKVANLGFRHVKRGSQVSTLEDGADPALWGKMREAYVAVTADALEALDMDSSLVPAPKKVRSLGKAVEVVDPEPDIGITLSLLEMSYMDHLKHAFEGRYA